MKQDKAVDKIVYVVTRSEEHSDLLFQRIKDAGYEWNTDKKELIKL